MNQIQFKTIGLTRTLSLMGLLVACSFAMLQAAPPPSAFGVWDRADKFDPKEYPFLKGFSFDQKWADLEKEPGVFDWSGLDEVMEKNIGSSDVKKIIYSTSGHSPMMNEPDKFWTDLVEWVRIH